MRKILKFWDLNKKNLKMIINLMNSPTYFLNYTLCLNVIVTFSLPKFSEQKGEKR